MLSIIIIRYFIVKDEGVLSDSVGDSFNLMKVNGQLGFLELLWARKKILGISKNKNVTLSRAAIDLNGVRGSLQGMVELGKWEKLDILKYFSTFPSLFKTLFFSFLPSCNSLNHQTTKMLQKKSKIIFLLMFHKACLF